MSIWSRLFGSRPTKAEIVDATTTAVNDSYTKTITSLHDAARSGDEAVVRSLLASGASASPRDLGGLTPLILAVSHGHKSVAALLLGHGADANAKDVAYGFTALHHAADAGLKDLVSLLIANRSELDAVDLEGSTPLHRAAFWGHTSVATALLGAGASLDAKDNFGFTPLDHAARKNHTALTELLRASSKP